MNKIEVEIFYQKWTIYYVEDLPADKDDYFLWGNCNHVDRIIRIRTNRKDGTPMSYDEIIRTTIHELIHAIASEGYYDEMTEQMTEFFAGCLSSLVKQLYKHMPFDYGVSQK